MDIIVKALVSGILIAVASEVAKRSSLLGALIISLPLASILGIVWLYLDTHNTDKVISFSNAIFVFIPPSLVFFLLLPLALRQGLHFWLALGLASIISALVYSVWTWALERYVS